MKTKFSPLWLTYTGALIALQVVLGNLVQIALLTKQMNFGFLPIAAAGYLLGPVGALLVAALGDVLGTLLFGTGAYLPYFTITAALVGLSYGWTLFPGFQRWIGRLAESHVGELLIRALLAAVLAAIIYIFLNSYWLTLVVGKGYMALLLGRLPFNLAEIPIFTVLIVAMCLALDRMPPSLLPNRGESIAKEG